MNDTLLPMVEQRLERRFGRPTKDLYREVASPSLSDPALRKAITWHRRLLQADYLLRQFDDALLPFLTDEELTPQRAKQMAGLAERVIQLQAARQSIAMIIMEAVASTDTYTTGAAPDPTPAHGPAQPAPRRSTLPAAASSGTANGSRWTR
ncbi:hypothetical protein [Streptomyces sp. NPDC127098]|uniref:hypothetical protein n=1 Tax=Streptomyces sp. NPDC127098 TaxID=3347137 RepID=UPI00365FC4CE